MKSRTDTFWLVWLLALFALPLAPIRVAGASTCSVDWQWTNPLLLQGNPLNAVTYGNAQLVAVGDWGAILTSPCVSTPTAPNVITLAVAQDITAPSVITRAASGITASAATLNGEVNANGADASAYFEYGLTPDYGDLVAASPDLVGSTAGNTAVTAGLEGLICNTTYHYRAKAENLVGRTYGGDQTFVTAACRVTAPSVITRAASGITASATTLNGEVNANGADASTYFEYGPTPGYGALVIATPDLVGAAAGNTAVASALTGLTCNHSYHYRVQASNSAGSGYGSDQSFTTSACLVTAPSVITGAASAITATAATLNGTVNANGADASVSFDYGLTASYGSSATASPSSIGAGAGDTAVTAALSGLICNHSYHYRVQASNSAGSGYGSDQSFTTSACLVTAPSVITGAASAITATDATLNGTVNASGADASADFEYGPTLDYGAQVAATPDPVGAAAGNTAVAAALAGLACDHTYHYRVQATNRVGTTHGGDQSLTTLACPLPPPVELPPLVLSVEPGTPPNAGVSAIPRGYPVPNLSPAGPGDEFVDESIEGIASDPEGNLYITGYTYSGSSYGIDILKYDVDGNLLWHRVYKSPGQVYGYGVTLDPAHALYVAGYRLAGNTYRGVLLKYGLDGNLLWQRDFTTGGLADTFYAVAADADAVYAVGESYNGKDFDALIVRYDPDGNQVWTSLRHTSSTNTAYDVQLRDCLEGDRGGASVRIRCHPVVGGGQDTDEHSGWLIALDPVTGAIENDQTVTAEAPIFAVALPDDGTLYAGGPSPKGNWQIVRVDRDFNPLWEIAYNDGGYDRLRDLALDNEGYLYGVGSTDYGGNQDVLIVAFDAAGTPLSRLRLGAADKESGHGIVFDNTQRLFVSGQDQSPIGDTQFLLFRVYNEKTQN